MKRRSKVTRALLWNALLLSIILVSVSHAVAQTCAVPPAGLVSWWPGDGSTDDIGDTNPGALQNGAAFSAGKVGPAFDLRAPNAHVSIPFNPNLQVPALTLDAWVNPASFVKPGGDPSGFNDNTIFSNGAVTLGICGDNGPGSGICDAWLGPGQAGRLYGFVRTGGAFDGQWRLSPNRRISGT